MARRTHTSLASRALYASLCLAVGCAGSADREVPRTTDPVADPVRSASERETARVGGEVIATVDGDPIYVRDVERVVRESGLTPTLALRRLEGEMALAHHAEGSAVAADPEIERSARSAAVRELLHRDVEAALTPEAVPEAVVEERRSSLGGALSSPETRRAVHVLVRLDSSPDPARLDAAMRLARRIEGELATASDVGAAMDGYVGRQGAFDVVVEHLDPMRRDALEAPFADALFTATAPGLLPDVVRTSYGVHVIALTEIVPPWEVPREEWVPALRRQLAAEARAQATEDLATRLAEGVPILVDDRALGIAQTMPLGSDPSRRTRSEAP